MPNVHDGTWIPLPAGCLAECCEGGSGEHVEMCAALCDGCSDQIPCAICVQILEWTVDSDNPLCGSFSIVPPEAHISDITGSFTDTQLIGYSSQFNLQGTVIREVNNYIRCPDGHSPAGRWHFTAGFVPAAPCNMSEGDFIEVTDILELSCDLRELFGTHTIEFDGIGDDGFPYHVHLVYQVTPGRGCGVTVSGCSRKISKQLKSIVSYSFSDSAIVYVEWNGSGWEGDGAASTGHTVHATITNAGGVWHAVFTDVTSSTTLFDADLDEGDACLPGSLSGSDVGRSSGATVTES